MYLSAKKKVPVYSIAAVAALCFYCSMYTPVETTPPILQFCKPLPGNDTVSIDEYYSVFIDGSLEDNDHKSVSLFFNDAPQGYVYDTTTREFTWKADKNVFTTDDGPFRITAGLTDMHDTLYHTWTLHIDNHIWELMSSDEQLIGFAAFDSGLVFKLCERKDSVVEKVGYLTGYIERSHNGGSIWETSPVYSKVLKRFFTQDMYKFEGLQRIRVFNNSVYFVWHVAAGNTGPTVFEAWSVLSIKTNASPFSKDTMYFDTPANHRHHYYIAPISGKVYQLSSSVSQSMTFAAASIYCDTVQELRLNQSNGRCITGPEKKEVVWATFYYYGVYRKIGTTGSWQNVCATEFNKIEFGDAYGDTLYFSDEDSAMYYAVGANTAATLSPQKITSVDKVKNIKMQNGRTGWILTSQGEVYFTNNMFATICKEHIQKEGAEVKIIDIVKAFNGRHIFAVGENGEIFRY